jgi:hypothetical protein
MTTYVLRLESAECIRQTYDDVLQWDGKGDEVYFRVDAALTDTNGNQYGGGVHEHTTRVYGDVNQFPNRVKAGSASKDGGIVSGDCFPIGLEIWRGELREDLGLMFVPTIWEWDNDDFLYDGALKIARESAPKLLTGISKGIARLLGETNLASAIMDGTAAGLPGLADLTEVVFGNADDRPIGVKKDGSFVPHVIVLTQSVAEAVMRDSFFGQPPGTIAVEYRDETGDGHYRLLFALTEDVTQEPIPPDEPLPAECIEIQSVIEIIEGEMENLRSSKQGLDPKKDMYEIREINLEIRKMRDEISDLQAKLTAMNCF